MSRIPIPALFWGYVGLLPFLYGVALVLSREGSLPTLGIVTSDAGGGVLVLERFGGVILAFMGGCLWGFGSAPGARPGMIMLAATILPAAIAFLAIRSDPQSSCIWLAFGFAVLQAIDVGFRNAGIAPDYWLGLRLPLTALVMLSLLIGALYG